MAATTQPAPGTRLPIGADAIVIGSKPGSGGGFVVLCVCEGAYEPFVTWTYDPEKPAAFAGHYFGDIRDAVADYDRRA